MIRDRLVSGIQKKLLRERDLTYVRALAIAPMRGPTDKHSRTCTTTPGTLRANEENPTLEGVTGVAVPDTNQATVDSKRLPVTISEKKDM